MYYPQRAEPTVRQDKHKWDNQLEFLNQAFSLNDRWGIAIDGGGFVGAWTREMSKRFDQVITFEPIPENWEACSRNNQKSNVCIYQCCLGGDFNPIKLGMTDGNCFGQKALSKDQRNYPSMTIDSLELPVDFIKLDLDGCEDTTHCWW
jgi:FkbM family methyltransferase